MSQLLDTGFLYALLNSNEARHADVLRASQSVRPGMPVYPILLPSTPQRLVL